MQLDERERKSGKQKTFAPLRNVILFYFFIKLPQKHQTVLIITVYSNEWNTGHYEKVSPRERKKKLIRKVRKNLIISHLSRGIFN